MNAQDRKEVTYHVRRFQPGIDQTPHWESYTIPYEPGLTVLDGLWRIKELHDPTLAWRASCRMGICGSCGMMINGSPRLACNTQIAELGTGAVAVAPLPNFAIIKDLVPDLQPMLEAHAEVMPYLIREDQEEQNNPKAEYHQTEEELEAYLQFSYCIKCGCCMAACPTYATDPVYAGPMPLSQAQRYNTDSRDGGLRDRKKVLGRERGPWRCHYAGECSKVCPKGVDPAKAIQIMKKQMVLDYFRLLGKKCPTELASVPANAQRREGIPEAPPRTV